MLQMNFSIFTAQNQGMTTQEGFIKRNKRAVSDFIRRHRLEALTDVALFIIITLVIHFSFRYWASQFHFYPVTELYFSLSSWLSEQVYAQSIWFVEHVLKIPFTTVDQTCTMYFANSGYIAVNSSCSGFKPMLQFMLLIMIYPGPWRHKLWFIPMGLFIVHLTNLFRITGLSVVIVQWPDYWDFSHDYLFRPFFYVVIFSLWVWWVERFRPMTKKTKATS
jgi:exosortase/archaeosortase family protein